MAERDEALLARMGQRMVKAIKGHLVIKQEPSPLPSPDDPLYELCVVQHRLIADLRARRR